MTEKNNHIVNQLPKDWKWVKLGEAVQVLDNLRKPINSSERQKRIAGKREKKLFPYYGATGQVGWIDSFITNGEYILVGEDGAPFLDIYKEKAYKIKGKTWVNNHAHILQEIKSISNNDFILHYLNSINYRQYVNGTTRLKLTKGSLVEIPFPVPSITTQQAIVSKIEELFSELDKGIENLRIAQQQLKTYRQSVLKWAFEGKLNNENVKEGELPKGWRLVKIEDATISLDNKRKPINKDERKKRQGNIPYYGANGQVGWIDDYIFDEPLVCVVEDETFTGRELPFSYKITGKAWVNNHAHVLKPKDDLNIDYLNYQLFYYPFLRLTTGTTGRKKLTKNALSNAPIKVCPIEEQNKIVQEIESRLSVADKMEESITQSLQQAEALRQSILKKAFEGRLL